jgi:hypothetical protein
MKHNLITLILCFLCYSSVVFAQKWQQEKEKQETKTTFDKSKLTFGGNFGIGFDDESTIITISPQVGYYFTPKVNIGAGIGYSYHKYDIDGETAKFNYYGINAYGRFFPVSFLVLQIQPDLFYSTRNMFGEKSSGLVPALLIGAGMRLGSITAMLQYDLIKDKYSPYGTSIFYGIGYMF